MAVLLYLPLLTGRTQQSCLCGDALTETCDNNSESSQCYDSLLYVIYYVNSFTHLAKNTMHTHILTNNHDYRINIMIIVVWMMSYSVLLTINYSLLFMQCKTSGVLMHVLFRPLIQHFSTVFSINTWKMSKANSQTKTEPALFQRDRVIPGHLLLSHPQRWACGEESMSVFWHLPCLWWWWAISCMEQ